jgi:hypothetical protein
MKGIELQSERAMVESKVDGCGWMWMDGWMDDG